MGSAQSKAFINISETIGNDLFQATVYYTPKDYIKGVKFSIWDFTTYMEIDEKGDKVMNKNRIKSAINTQLLTRKSIEVLHELNEVIGFLLNNKEMNKQAILMINYVVLEFMVQLSDT